MEEVLTKSFGFIFIILLGYALKKIHFFKREDGVFFSNLVMNVTLPASLIANANGMTIDISTIIVILIGLFANIFMVIFSKMIYRKQSPVSQGIAMINCSGYNVGNFAMPFAASFFGAEGMMHMCMFDIGNALMGLGGTYAFARNVVDGRGRMNLRNLGRVIIRSIPFDVYVLLFFISLFKITIPTPITSIASMIGSANGFLAMLMIGILLEINITKEQLKSVSKILSIRYIGNALMAIVIYAFFPLPLIAKQMIVLILFSPISSVAAVYSQMIDEDDPSPALANSISIIISIVVLTGLLLVFA